MSAAGKKKSFQFQTEQLLYAAQHLCHQVKC